MSKAVFMENEYSSILNKLCWNNWLPTEKPISVHIMYYCTNIRMSGIKICDHTKYWQELPFISGMKVKLCSYFEDDFPLSPYAPSLWSRYPTHSIHLREMKAYIHIKTCSNVHSSFVCKSQSLEIIHVSITGWLYKPIVIYPQTAIVFNYERRH